MEQVKVPESYEAQARKLAETRIASEKDRDPYFKKLAENPDLKESYIKDLAAKLERGNEEVVHHPQFG